jgi:hypothetical protein
MQSLDLGDCRLRNPRSREIEREREICWDVRVKKVDDTSSSTHACMHARWYLQDDCVGLFFFFFFFFLFPFFFFLMSDCLVNLLWENCIVGPCGIP